MVDLEQLLVRLLDAQLDFVVIGGMAAVAHGSPLLTDDIDICCDFSPSGLLRVQAAVADLHPVQCMHPSRPPLDLTAQTARGLETLHLDTDYGRLDCLNAVAGVGDFAAARADSVEIELAGRVCRILSLDALIRAREAVEAPRHRQALLFLRAIRERQDEHGRTETHDETIDPAPGGRVPPRALPPFAGR